MPDTPLAGQTTLREALQTGVRRSWLAWMILGPASAEQSPADMLEVPASVLADKLAGHLVQEIILRGVPGRSAGPAG